MNNYEIIERITGTCAPTRNNTLTGANQHDTSWYPYRSAEPSRLVVTATGVEGTGEFLPVEIELPGYSWLLLIAVEVQG